MQIKFHIDLWRGQVDQSEIGSVGKTPMAGHAHPVVSSLTPQIVLAWPFLSYESNSLQPGFPNRLLVENALQRHSCL